MAKAKLINSPSVVEGVDTHKDLHVAAVVDRNNRVLGSEFFATTRQGYRQMLAWMASFGTVERIGVECTGSYGAGLLRYLQSAEIEVLEVTAPDKMECRKRGKSDTIDAESAAHAAFSRIRTVTPKTRSGMIEALTVVVIVPLIVRCILSRSVGYARTRKHRNMWQNGSLKATRKWKRCVARNVISREKSIHCYVIKIDRSTVLK